MMTLNISIVLLLLQCISLSNQSVLRLKQQNELKVINLPSEFNIIHVFNINNNINLPVIRFDLSRVESLFDPKPDLYLIRLDYDKIISFFSVLKYQSTFNPRAFFIIITDDQDVSITNILKTDFYMFNVHVFNEDSFEKGILNIDFQKKYVYEKRDIRVNYYVLPPHTTHSATKEKGIEIKVMQIVADFLKINIKFTETNYTNWGNKINKTYTNLWGMLQRNECDVIMGDIHDKFNEHLDFDMCYPYLSDFLTFAVPKAKLQESWKIYILVFSLPIWMAILGIDVVLLIVHYLVSFDNEHVHLMSTTFLAIISFAFENIYSYSVKKSKPFSIFIIFTYLYFMLLNTAYKSQMFYFLTGNNYDKDLNTLNEFMEHKLKFGMPQNLMSLMKFDDPHTETYIKNNFLNCNNMTMCLKRTAYKRDVATVMTERQIQYFTAQFMDDQGRALVHNTNFPIILLSLSLFFVKGHPSFQRVNMVVRRLRENGMILNLYQNFTLRYYKALAISEMKAIEADEMTLSLTNTAGAFMVYCIGIFISFLVFVVEYVKNKWF